MPYAIAHPVAVIPLSRALGRRAVPSALAIGSVIPDAWYMVPGLDRPFSHDASGLLWFCLPAGLLAYVLFHGILKEPLLQLAPPTLASRLRAFASTGFPKNSILLVALNVLAGAITHVAWDAFTHRGRLARLLPFLTEDFFRLLQHGSTLIGGAFLVWWIVEKLHAAVPREGPVLPGPARAGVLAGMAAATLLAGAWAFSPEVELRQALRAVAAAGAGALIASALAYSALLALSLRRVRTRTEAMPSPAVTQSASAPSRASSTSNTKGAVAWRKRAGIMSRPWRRP
jgi:hypothetical protein